MGARQGRARGGERSGEDLISNHEVGKLPCSRKENFFLEYCKNSHNYF